MALPIHGTFARWLEALRATMHRPTFGRFVDLARGWVLTAGAHTVAAALVAGDLASDRHHEAYHRFFSRRAWSPDELGRLLFDILLRLFTPAALTIALDDTLAPKKGPKVFGLGTHLNPVRSTRRHRIFTFGHVWVVLAVLVRVPFTTRSWALPVLFRLYRNEKECTARGDVYRKKTELAREMLDVFATWTSLRTRVVADLAYCCSTVNRGLPDRFVFVGAMRPDAVLTALPTLAERKATGRRRKRGVTLPKPEALAADSTFEWRANSITLYGRQLTAYTKSLVAQWYVAFDVRLLHVVVVRVDHGNVPFRVFFSSDPALDAGEILETYGGRWAIEVAFRNLKQHLGFADSPARLRRAVERTAPFAGLIYTALVLWFVERISNRTFVSLPSRSWYRHKTTLSFEDVLRAARLDLLPAVFDPPSASENLRNTSASASALRRAQKFRPERRGADPPLRR